MSSEETALGLDESAKDYELPPLVNILNVEGRGCVASSSGHDTSAVNSDIVEGMAEGEKGDCKGPCGCGKSILLALVGRELTERN